ncbi:MAG: hypothetical protein DHS20C01_11270 [marine bacterium B5-7]|nr:MAG: hypothetical protein DHS20C01_11270 [marine bacterium B5-7]
MLPFFVVWKTGLIGHGNKTRNPLTEWVDLFYAFFAEARAANTSITGYRLQSKLQLFAY